MSHRSQIRTLIFVLFIFSLACSSTVQERDEAPVATEGAMAGAAPLATFEVPEAPVESVLADPGVIARDHLATISQGIGPRVAGTVQEARTAEYISQVFTKYGYEVESQPFDFEDDEDGNVHSTNIMAVKQGISPQEIIVGAHYDSVRRGEGADDNASGVAVLLELAMHLQAVETPYTVRFISFGAEEYGLEGSSHYVSQLSSEEIDAIIGMINLDSVIAGDYLYIYSNVEIDDTLQVKLVDEDTPGINFIGMTLEELDMDGEDPCECSDYEPFSAVDIPFVYIEATNWEMGDQDGYTQTGPEYGSGGMLIHTKYDTLEYFDRVFPGRVDQQLSFLVAELYDLLVNNQ